MSYNSRGPQGPTGTSVPRTTQALPGGAPLPYAGQNQQPQTAPADVPVSTLVGTPWDVPTGAVGAPPPAAPGPSPQPQFTSYGSWVTPATPAEVQWEDTAFWDQPTTLGTYADTNQQAIENMGLGGTLAGAAGWGALGEPNTQGDYFNDVLASGGPTSNTQDVFDWFAQTSPADMSGYYDRGEANATADINRQFAARGMYGSSAATDALANAYADMEAQQARDEAQYGLDRASLGGTLAGAADTASLGSVMGLGELAKNAGEGSLDKYKVAGELGLGYEGLEQGSEQGAANIYATQDKGDLAKESTAQDITFQLGSENLEREKERFDQQVTLAAQTAGLSANAFQNMNEEETAIMEMIMAGDIPGATQAINSSQQISENFRADAGVLIAGVGTAVGAGQ